MKKEIALLNSDLTSPAVINAKEELHNIHFPEKMLMPFATPEVVENFLRKYPHKKIDQYLTISSSPFVYEVNITGKKIGLCRAPLGAPATVQLEEFLIAGGAKKILASGTCGIIGNLPKDSFIVPTKALRDEGTSFHYMPASRYVNLDSKTITSLKTELEKLNVKYQEVITWTTDAFFRETEHKIKEYTQEGISTVEMECAGLAACAKFRKIQFAQLLFTADSLTGLKHNRRDWGADTHPKAIDLAAKLLTNI